MSMILGHPLTEIDCYLRSLHIAYCDSQPKISEISFLGVADASFAKYTDPAMCDSYGFLNQLWLSHCGLYFRPRIVVVNSLERC